MTRVTPNRYRVLLASALLLLACQTAVQASKLYRWVDAEGNVHYSDRIPPEQIKQGREELNEQGRTVKSVDRAKTDAELEAAEIEAAKQAERDRQAREQAAHDRVLLQTYSSLDDIVRSRSRKLNAIDATIRVTEGRIDKLNVQLDREMENAANAERRGEPVPKTVQEAIDSIKRQIDDNLKYVETRRADMQRLEQGFDADIQRYKELKHLP